jgi:transcriptional regulator with XRE-family HTH domain
MQRMTARSRWEITLEEQHQNARDIGSRLAQMRKQRGLTQAQVARAMGVSQARVSRMEHGDVDRMQVESIAAYIAAMGGHLRLVADFDQDNASFIDYTDVLTIIMTGPARSEGLPVGRPHAQPVGHLTTCPELS